MLFIWSFFHNQMAKDIIININIIAIKNNISQRFKDSSNRFWVKLLVKKKSNFLKNGREKE